MISLKIQVQGSDVMIHLPNDNTTTNYHVTKHTILGYDDEGFKHYIGINKKEISKIREKQISDYNCKVSHIVSQKNSCNNCVKVFECKTSIEMVIEKYIKIIKNGLISDHKNPRHVLFYDNKYKSDTLLVLDKKAITIICEKKKERYFFKTCYRMANFRNISDIQLAFKKVMTDLDLYLVLTFRSPIRL